MPDSSDSSKLPPSGDKELLNDCNVSGIAKDLNDDAVVVTLVNTTQNGPVSNKNEDETENIDPPIQHGSTPDEEKMEQFADLAAITDSLKSTRQADGIVTTALAELLVNDPQTSDDVNTAPKPDDGLSDDGAASSSSVSTAGHSSCGGYGGEGVDDRVAADESSVSDSGVEKSPVEKSPQPPTFR